VLLLDLSKEVKFVRSRGAWAITLSRLFTSIEEDDGASDDVVFGQVVHGRGGNFAKFKILNRHSLNVLLLDLSKEVKFVRSRGQVYSDRDDIETWTDNAVLVGDSKSSTMYDPTHSNYVC
jgi:hypothetical protein